MKIKKSFKNGLVLIAASSLALSTTVASAEPAVVYMESVNSQVTLTPFLTAGDKVGSYVVPGIPDGFGALPGEKGMLKLLTSMTRLQVLAIKEQYFLLVKRVAMNLEPSLPIWMAN